MTTDWRILRGDKTCASCGTAFEENEDYYSALYDRKTEFERLDYCNTCWQGETEAMFSFWQTRVPAKEQKTRLLVDDNVLLEFFQRLEGQTDELKVNFRFILSLILMRRRILKFIDTKREEGREFLVLSLPKEKRVYEVFNPNLDDEKIALVTEEVGQILNVEL